MFKGLGNIASLLSQAHTFGPKMEQITDELKNKRVVGTGGGGMVTVNANGLGQIINIEIDPILVDKGDMEMVKDLLPAAINQAIGKAKQLHMESMKSLTGGLSLPGLDQAMSQFTGNLSPDSDGTSPSDSAE